MSPTRIQNVRDKLAKTYAIGILVFAGIFGFVTVFASFLAHLKLT